MCFDRVAANIACFSGQRQSRPVIRVQIFTMHLFSVVIMNTYFEPQLWALIYTNEQSSHTFVCRQIFPACTIFISWPWYSSNSSSNFCLHFSSGQGEAEARSRRSLASAGGDQGPGHYDDHHPPNITPVGGVPNLKVISHQSIRD